MLDNIFFDLIVKTMQKDSSSLSRSSSSSKCNFNSSNPNNLGSHYSPKIFKNKDFKLPIHRRIIQRNNYHLNCRIPRNNRNTKVKAISVKKAKKTGIPLQKSISVTPFLACSGEVFNKSPT